MKEGPRREGRNDGDVRVDVGGVVGPRRVPRQLLQIHDRVRRSLGLDKQGRTLVSARWELTLLWFFSRFLHKSVTTYRSPEGHDPDNLGRRIGGGWRRDCRPVSVRQQGQRLQSNGVGNIESVLDTHNAVVGSGICPVVLPVLSKPRGRVVVDVVGPAAAPHSRGATVAAGEEGVAATNGVHSYPGEGKYEAAQDDRKGRSRQPRERPAPGGSNGNVARPEEQQPHPRQVAVLENRPVASDVGWRGEEGRGR